MKNKILITRKIDLSAVTILNEKFDVDYIALNEPLSYNFLLDNIYKYDGVLSTITEKFDEGIMEASKKKLKIISNMAVGTDNIDLKAADKYGIKVFNTPDVVTDSTADFTIALGLSFLRQIIDANLFIKENKWKKWDPDIFNGRSLRDLSWGIIGFGRVGKAVAERLKGFGIKIFYYDITEVNDSFNYDFVEYLEFDKLLKLSDVISIHTPLNENTKNLINYPAFQKMSKKPLLINMARGAIINSFDLVNALQEGLISGAALDVFDPEPISSDHPILKFKNVLITPHIGTATIECRRDMAIMAAKNIIKFFED